MSARGELSPARYPVAHRLPLGSTMSVKGCIFNIIILNTQESGVGKTCIVNRFVSDTFSEHESLTVG